MQRTLKSLSLLLSYPSEELQDAIAHIRAALHGDRLLQPCSLQDLGLLLDELEATDLYELEERYVALFDRSRSLSLNLFEHVHGESRERGGAMVDLVETYRTGGFEPTGRELPDHLPVLLEFLSTRPLDEARETLADAAHILEALRLRLSRRDAPYAAVFAALVSIARCRPDREALAELTREADEDPDDLVALDAAWAETEVRFVADPNEGCPVSRETLARMAVSPAATSRRS